MNKTQFIRLLSTPGIKVKMTYWQGELIPHDAKLAEVRTVDKVQSNAIKFSNGSWLYFNEIKPNEVRLLDNGDISIGWATYRVWATPGYKQLNGEL